MPVETREDFQTLASDANDGIAAVRRIAVQMAFDKRSASASRKWAAPYSG
jgi:hypothetical protein